MNKLLTLGFVLCTYIAAFAQNIIPNPGFENQSYCPNSVGNVNAIDDWFTPPSQGGSADYFHTCTVNSLIAIPHNYWGSEIPLSGEGYVGLNLIYYTLPDFREYLQIKLDNPLTAGKKYLISFHYSLADKSEFATDDFGLFFSDTLLTGTGNYLISLTPQVTITNFLDNPSGWTRVDLEYIANGGEEYMTFGNFKDDASTNVIASTGVGHNGSYLYFDDFSLTEDSCFLSLGEDQTLCEGESITLNATTTNGTYQWQDNSTSATFTVTESGTYWVNVNADCGSYSDTIVVDFVEPVSVDLGNDTTLCDGESYVLDATASNVSYLWQDNSTDPTFTVTASGLYAVGLMNACGVVEDEINITFLSKPIIDLGPDTNLCFNEMMTIGNLSNENTYLWQDGSTQPYFEVKETGVYWVKAENNCGARYDTINVVIQPEILVHLGSDTSICEDSLIVLTVGQQTGNFLWQDGSSEPDMPTTEPGVYWVTVFNEQCFKSDTIEIFSFACESVLELPNVFTPNNDGVNDQFIPIKSKHINSMHTVILNRWGNTMFETNNLSIGWDGGDANDGTYFWFVNYTDMQGAAKQVNGVVTLVR